VARAVRRGIARVGRRIARDPSRLLVVEQFIWLNWTLHQLSTEKLTRMDALVRLRRAAIKAERL
jgi:hypothetical protein